MYNFVDTVEGIRKVMSKDEVLKFAIEFHENVEGEFPKDERIPEPTNILDAAEYLVVFNIYIQAI